MITFKPTILTQEHRFCKTLPSPFTTLRLPLAIFLCSNQSCWVWSCFVVQFEGGTKGALMILAENGKRERINSARTEVCFFRRFLFSVRLLSKITKHWFEEKEQKKLIFCSGFYFNWNTKAPISTQSLCEFSFVLIFFVGEFFFLILEFFYQLSR